MNWTEAPLGEVTQILSGTTPDSGNPAFWSGSHVWVTPTDLGKLKTLTISQSERCITDLALQEKSLPRIPKNSVVMSSRAPIGHLAIAGCDLYTNQGCKSFVCSEKLDSEFLFFTLRHRMGDIQALGSGSTFMEVSKSALESFQICFPHIDEQRRIAARLKAQLAEVTTAQQAVQAQLHDAALLRQRLLQHAFDETACFDISAITLEATTEGCGLMCDGDWIESRDQDPAGSIRLIQLADIGDGCFLNKSRRFINDETLQRLNCTLLQEGDVLIARMPDPLGRTCVFPKLEQRAITAVDVCIVRTDPSKVDHEWLSFRLNSAELRRKIQSHAQGATRARVPTRKLKELSFGLPALEEQRRIVATLKAQLAEADALRAALEQQLRDVQALPQRLLAAAFAH